MLNVNELIGFGAGGKTIADSYYVGTSEVIATATVFNHNSVDIGNPDPTRVLVVTTSTYSSSPTITGVTIDGNAMTKAVNNLSSSALSDVAIFYSPWPAGKTANFVVTKGGSNSNNNHLSVHALYGLQGNAPYSTTVSDANPAVLNDDITAPSFGIAVAQAVGATTYTFTWTGLTEDYRRGWSSKTEDVASQLILITETSRTIKTVYSGGGHFAAAFAVWK